MTAISTTLSNSSEAQRARLLEHLKQFGSATTIELRRDLDVMMPAARAHELRHNSVITSQWLEFINLLIAEKCIA